MLVDWGTLSGIDAGDEGGGWGSGASVQKKRVDVGTSLCVGEISLTINEAALLTTFLLIKSHFLPLDASECVFMSAEASDICDDAGILEFNKCVVDDEAGEMVRMEDA